MGSNSRLSRTGKIIAGILLVAVALCGSGIVPAIIPNAVPTANKRGNSNVFALASSNSAASAGTTYCDDGSGNLTTSGCTNSSGSVNAGTQFQMAQYPANGSTVGGVTLTDCHAASSAVTFTASSGVFGCNSISAGTTVTVAPPYIVISGTNYLPWNMFSCTLLSTASWVNINSTGGTLNTTANGLVTLDATAGNFVWWTSPVLTAFTQITVADTHGQYLINNGVTGNLTGTYAWDSANNLIWGLEQATNGTDQLFFSSYTWNGSTASTPAGAATQWQMIGLHFNFPWKQWKMTVNGGAKTISMAVSLDGGLTFKTVNTSGAQTSTPSFTKIVASANSGTLAIASVATAP
jgi:hypothetical protein